MKKWPEKIFDAITFLVSGAVVGLAIVVLLKLCGVDLTYDDETVGMIGGALFAAWYLIAKAVNSWKDEKIAKDRNKQ